MVSETGIDLVSDFLIGPGRHTRLFDQPLDFAVEFFDVIVCQSGHVHAQG